MSESSVLEAWNKVLSFTLSFHVSVVISTVIGLTSILYNNLKGQFTHGQSYKLLLLKNKHT